MRLLLAALLTSLPGLAMAGTAACYITEIAAQPPLVQQTLILGARSASSSAFNARSKMAAIHCDAAAYVASGATPTATPSSAVLLAGQVKFYRVPAGPFKLAVLAK